MRKKGMKFTLEPFWLYSWHKLRHTQQLDTSISYTNPLLKSVSLILKYYNCVNQKLMTSNFIHCLLILFANLYRLERLKIKNDFCIVWGKLCKQGIEKPLHMDTGTVASLF